MPDRARLLPHPSARGPLLVLIAVALSLAAWAPAIFAEGPVLDDAEVLERNPVVQGAVPWWEAFRRDYWDHVAAAGHYRPIASLSLRLDVALHGGAWAGFHATNVLLHAAVVGAAGLALVLLGARHRTGAFPWIGLGLFAVHPTLADSVAWMSGRTSMLAALGGSSGVVALLLVTVPWRPARAKRIAYAAVASAVGLLLALLSKEDGVVFGAIYLVLGFRHSRRLAVAVATGCAVAVVAYLALRAPVYGTPWPGAAFAPLAGEPLPVRLLHGGRAVFEGLWIAVVPAGHPPRYERSPSFEADSEGFALLGALGLAVVAALIAAPAISLARRRDSLVAWSALFTGLCAIPMLQIVPAGALFAPRFLYLPLLLAIPLVDGGLRDALGRATRYAAPLLLALGIAGAHVRTRVYHDDLAYWGEQARWSPADATAHNELGLAWEDRGELQRAREEFLRAVELDPGYSRPWTNLGRLALDAGDLDEAERCFRKAVDRGRRNAVARFNLGSLLLQRGKPEEAAEELAEATQLAPGLQPAWRKLARALLAAGETEEALLAVARALELDPSDEGARELERSIVAARERER